MGDGAQGGRFAVGVSQVTDHRDVLARLTAALGHSYRVERELGAGGMATVYLLHDLKHERDVAIKVLHPDLAAALGGERFLSEIRTTARSQHPHILGLLDSGAADGLLYYVMPYVRGESLRARLERETQLPVSDALAIATAVADALAEAHAAGIVHRDIKPDNILLQQSAQGTHPFVADFGIALAVQQSGGARMTMCGRHWKGSWRTSRCDNVGDNLHYRRCAFAGTRFRRSRGTYRPRWAALMQEYRPP